MGLGKFKISWWDSVAMPVLGVVASVYTWFAPAHDELWCDRRPCWGCRKRNK